MIEMEGCPAIDEIVVYTIRAPEQWFGVVFWLGIDEPRRLRLDFTTNLSGAVLRGYQVTIDAKFSKRICVSAFIRDLHRFLVTW